MEVDQGATDQCKETGGGALLAAQKEAGGSLSADPMQIDEGQQPISCRCTTLCKLL
jgi:hypothetical protein